ncbi:FecR domain-containing protein [uncultured Draconibacterium sp.]|uniref:FecR family protein n=1 Tax=uncultured Draconibacterium sp. TaxID=1573823 RepID=UPI003216AD70
MNDKNASSRKIKIQNEDQLHAKIITDPGEQKLEAAFLIQKIDSVDTERGFKNVSRRIEKKARFIHNINIISRVAAILLIPVLFLSVWYNVINKQNNQIETTYHTVNCPVGIKTQLSLPDGSLVWLNSGTTVKYQLPFTNKTRKIEMDGEAFFEIKKDRIPFIVNTGNAKVKVYGTEFNVKAYSSDNQIEVALKEGSIGFTATNNMDEKRLSPNDFLTFNKTTNAVETINQNINKYIAWRNNQLVFDETPLSEMALMLERWYGIQVEIKDDDLLRYKFTTTFENEPLLQVIELLELSSPIKIKYIPTKIDDQSNVISKAKIVINKK